MKKVIFYLIFFLILTTQIIASEKKVFYAGFSFSGNYIDKSSGIKYTDPLTKIKDEKKLLEDIGRVRSIEIDYNDNIYVGVENLGIIKLLE